MHKWNAKTLEFIEKIKHEENPELVRIAPRDVLVFSQDKIILSNSVTHKISDKQKELSSLVFDYSETNRGVISIPEFPMSIVLVILAISTTCIIFFTRKFKI